MTATTPPLSTAGTGSYPRPQLVRPAWVDLGGTWGFAYDDNDAGRADRWYADAGARAFDRAILVPFPPESAASGVADRGFHPVVWYRREITGEELRAAGLGSQGARLMLRFGAVDYRADVWLDGWHLGSHEGARAARDLV